MKKFSLYIMAVFYILAGINHFINPGFYEPIMPPWLGSHLFIIYFSGTLEICFGMLLFPGKTRTTAAWLIILLLIAIFPANIQMMLNDIESNQSRLWLSILRLPLQLLLIWWAYSFTPTVKPNNVQQNIF